MIACCLGILMALYVHKPPNPDQGIFDYIAWIGSMGGRYYADVAEQNFPGEMILHQLAFSLFGFKIWAYRALDFLIAVMGGTALYGLLRSGTGNIAALSGSAFYLAGYVSSNGWMSGQRDVVAANMLLFVGYCFLRRLQGSRRFCIVPLGLMLFFAILLRPTYLLFAIELSVIDISLRKQYSRHIGTCLIDAALAGLLLIVPAALMTGWAARAGSLSAFWDQVILFNTQAYEDGRSRVDTIAMLASNIGGYYLLIPGAMVAFLRLGKLNRRGALLWILSGLVLLSLASSLVQNKGFGYHLGAMLPPLYGLAGVSVWMACEAFIDRRRKPSGFVASMAFIAAIGLAGLLLQLKTLGPQIRFLLGREQYLEMMSREYGGQEGFTWADLYEAADYARGATGSDEDVLVWGRPVSINVLARRRSPSRFITCGMLLLAEPPFVRSDAWKREFLGMLAVRPPRLVFITNPGLDTGATSLTRNSNEASIQNALTEALATRYDYIKAFGSLGLYRLRN